MTIFWLVTALFVLGALLFLLPGLLWPRALPDAGAAVGLPSRRTALWLALLLPAASVLSYLKLGAPEAMSGPPPAASTSPRGSVLLHRKKKTMKTTWTMPLANDVSPTAAVDTATSVPPFCR